jgi:Flp pilus assembly protein TadG
MARIVQRKTRQRRRGTTLVEAAIVLQLLLVITLGAIEYGWLFLVMERITNAARHGARIAAAADVPMSDGELAISGLISDLTTASYSVTSDGTLVTATVSVPSKDVRLLNIPLLPAPATLSAVVKMAKERS